MQHAKKVKENKRIDMEGTSKTPHSQAEAYILSQQSSVRIVQVYRIQVG